MISRLKFIAVAVFMSSAVFAGSRYVPVSDGYIYINEEQNAIVKEDYKSGSSSEIAKLVDIRGEKINKIDDIKVSPDEGRILIKSVDDNFYIYKIESNKADKVSDSVGVQKCHTFSPDGKNMAFVRNNNLYIKRLQYNTEIAVTKDGCDTIFNGIRSAEFDSAFHQSKLIEFSPDGMYLLFTKNNELCMYSVQYKWTKKVTMPDNTAYYITNAVWNNEQDFILVNYLNKNQNLLRIAKVDAATFIARRVYEDKSKTYISSRVAKFVEVLPDNLGFITMSNEEGGRQLTMYSLAGTKLKQLTTGNIDVRRYYGYDVASKRIYYQASDIKKSDYGVYFSNIVKPQTNVLVENNGYSKALFAPDYKYFVLETSNRNNPVSYSIYDVKGKELRKLGSKTGSVLNFEPLENGMIAKSGNDEAKTILLAYNASNRYRNTLAQDLLQKGYNVAICESKATYGNMLNSRAESYVDFASKLIEKGIVKAADLYIAGEDLYGGVALMAAAKCNNFAGVIAISPVTDLRKYNSIITDRLMGVDKASDSYTLNSVVSNIDQIKCRILLVDYVESVDYEFVDKMVETNHQFDMQIYNKQNKSHLVNRIIRFINNK